MFENKDYEFQSPNKIGRTIPVCIGDDDIMGDIEEVAPISKLVPETLTAIFRHLSLPDKKNVAQVSKTWRDALYEPSICWKDVGIFLYKPEQCNLFPSLVKRGIRIVYICHPMEEIIVDIATGVPKLRTLYLVNFDFSIRAALVVSALQLMPKLTKLGLTEECAHVQDGTVEAIALNLKNLTFLELLNCNLITDSALSFIGKNLTKLKHLDLTGCSLLTDVGIANLVGSNESVKLALESLLLCDLKNLSDRSLHFLSVGQPSLVTLDLRSVGDGITDEGMNHVARMTNLRTLNIQCNLQFLSPAFENLVQGGSRIENLDITQCMNVVDYSVEHLAKLTNLRQLKMYESRVTDAGLARLVEWNSKIVRLEISPFNWVDISPVTITDDALKHLAKLSDLRWLTLSEFGNAAVAHLADAGSKIEVLQLINCSSQITVASWQHLAKLECLQELEIAGDESITADKLSLLANLNLKVLNIRNCSHIGYNGLATVACLFTKLNSLTMNSKQISDDGLILASRNLTKLHTFLVDGKSMIGAIYKHRF